MFLFTCSRMEFDETINGAKQFFKSGKTVDLQWRENQLRALSCLIEENRERIYTVLRNDLNKTDYESELYEITSVLNEIAIAINNMGYWSRTERIPADVRYDYESWLVKNTCL